MRQELPVDSPVLVDQPIWSTTPVGGFAVSTPMENMSN